MLFGLINGKSSIEISETRNNILLKEEKLLNKENLVMSDFLSKSKDDHASWSDDKKRQISKGDENGELPPTVDVTEMFQTEPLENESVTNYDIFDDLNKIYSGKVDISQYKIPQHSENIMPDSVSVINEGTSGMILKYRSQKDGRMYAIKKLKNTNEDGYLFNSINEYLIMRKLNNSNFTVRTFELFNDNGFISFTLDYFGNLDLLNMMTNLRKNNIQTSTLFKDMIFLQLVNGLKYIHNNRIIHKDIKPENILIDDNGVLKITDFGYAIDEERLEKYDNSFQNNAAFFQRGTPSFKAPELFVINPDILTINNKIDVWSLAILYFQISTLSKPWNVSKGTEDKNYKWYNQTYTVKRLNELKSGYQIKQLLKGYDNQFVTGLNRFNDNCVITIINMLNPDNARRWDIVQVFKSDWMINCGIEYGKNENNNEVMKILKVLKSCMKR